jgi:anaerobic dimethyl sulfoxide reductase subunit C (anchor subunit)
MSIQWPLVIFSLLAGSGAATLAFAGISEFLGSTNKVRFNSGIIAIALMIIGGIASVFHLGQPLNFMAAIANLGSLSGVSLELIFLGLAIIVGIIYVLLVRAENAASKFVGIIGLVLALIFAFITGHSYQIESQISWNTYALSIVYLTSAFALGGFVYLAAATVYKEDKDQIKKLGTVILVVVVLQLISFVVYGITVGLDKTDALTFWVLSVALGSIVPLIIAALLAFKEGSGTRVYVGLLGALLGGIGIRAFMWIAGTGWINAFTEAAANRGLYPF